MDRIKKIGQTTFSSLGIRNYRLYFIGQAISLSGTWMQTIAQGWLVLELTNSGTQLGIVVALQFLPLLLLGPWGGVVADRYNKRVILYCTNAVSAIMSLILSLLIFAGAVQLWHMYVFALALGVIRIFDNPIRQTFLAEMVGNAHLKNAISLNSTVNNLARVIGPTISGILVASVGIAFCFLVNAFSFIGALITLAYIRADELHTPAPQQVTKHQVRDSFAYVARTPLIRDTLIMMTLIGTFVFEFQVSLPILARQVFNGGAPEYALLMSALGAGSVVGGLYSAGRSSIAPRHLIVFAGLSGLSLFAVSIMPTLLLAVVSMTAVGFFTINVTALANTMIQLKSSPAMRGRVMALWSMAMMGSTPIGGPLVGFAGEYMGGRYGVAIGGVAAVAAALYGMSTLLKKDTSTKIPGAIASNAEQAVAEHTKHV